VLIDTRQLLGEAQVALNTIVVGRRKNLASRGQRGWAYLLLARLYYNKGQLDQAKHHINQAKSNMPSRDPAFLDELAGVLIDAHQLGDAENAIKQSKKIMQGRPHPYLHMARIHLLHGRPQTALEELKHAKGLQYAASNLLRAQILVELGRLKEASEEVDRALAMAEDLLEAHIVKAKVLAAQGQGGLAESKLKQLLAKHPKSAALHTAYGEILLKLNRIPEARKQLNLALEHNKHASNAWLKLAEVHMSQGDFAQAQRSLAEAVRTNPGNVMVLIKQAELELDMGNLAEAATNFREAHRRAVNDPNIRLSLARVLIMRRRHKQAEEEIRAAEAHGASQGVLALARGRLALHRAKAAEAVTFLQQATRSRPNDIKAWGLLVQAHLMNEDFSAARQTARTMAGKFSDAPEVAAAAARVDINEGKSLKAVGRLRPAITQLPPSARPPRVRAELLVLLGRAYQDSGKLGEAAAQFNLAIKACPSCAEPHYRKGQVQDERGQVEEAVASLERALALDPSYAEVHYDLGQIFGRTNNTSRAIEHYRKYLTFDPPKELADAARQAIRDLQSGAY